MYFYQNWCLSGDSDIQSLPVRRSHQEAGCEWTGTMEMLQGHMTECTFAAATISPSNEEDSDYDEILDSIKDGSSDRKETYDHLCQTTSISRGDTVNDVEVKSLPINVAPHMYEHVYDNIRKDEKSYDVTFQSERVQKALTKCNREIFELKTTLSALQRELATLKKTRTSLLRDNELVLVTLTDFAAKKTSDKFLSQMLSTGGTGRWAWLAHVRAPEFGTGSSTQHPQMAV